MECWSCRSLIILIIFLIFYKTEGKKVAVCFKRGTKYSDVNSVAKENLCKIVKKVGISCYVFQTTARDKRTSKNESDDIQISSLEQRLISNLLVKEAEISVPKVRVKKGNTSSRRSNPKVRVKKGSNDSKHSNVPRLDALARTFYDPMFSKQWHLYNTEFAGKDLNVLPVWANNVTGSGVVVAILDDGVEYTHPDIRDNYEASVSWDFLDDDSDPMPITSPADNNVDHGTRCAGQVAASKNNVCGVGVAFNAKIAGIRMLKNKVEDAMEAEALEHCRDTIDIYSSSWGPIDDGKKMDGPGLLVRNAFEEGVQFGRNGKGSIYVWASGNGGLNKDNCNCDGYCSSVYTISISAVNDKGEVPAYVEECSATLAAAYSSGTGADRRIATTDLNSGCTDEHGGTSAAAPLAAGVIALALSAKPDLSWRDVQHIIVQSSVHPKEEGTVINGAGRRVNNKIGFGILNSAAMVEIAMTWESVAKQHTCRIVRHSKDLAQRDAKIKEGQKLLVRIDTDACEGQSTEVAYVEHVQAVLSVEHELRGSLKIFIISPAGTTSALLTERPSDKNNRGFVRWTFLTVQMWGERASGSWTLTIESVGSGELTYFELLLFGTKYNVNSTMPPCRSFSLISNDGSESITCVDSCPQSGYYATNSRCLPCHPTCAKCTSFNRCTSCSERLYLLHEGNTCVSSCPDDYKITNSQLHGRVCQKTASTIPWYKGDAIYIIVVVIFVTLLIIVVLLISMHHYRKYKDRSTALRDGSLYSHTQLKSITTASFALPFPENARVTRDSLHVTSRCSQGTASCSHGNQLSSFSVLNQDNYASPSREEMTRLARDGRHHVRDERAEFQQSFNRHYNS